MMTVAPIPTTLTIHRLGERVQFVFTTAYDANIGMHPKNGDPIRLGPPKIVTHIYDCVLDLDKAIELRDCVSRGGDHVHWDFSDYRSGSYLRVRAAGDPFADGPPLVGITYMQHGCALAYIDLDGLTQGPFLFALDNAILGDARCSH